MGKLEGRVAIVTGGAQGIGRAIVEKLAQEGADVVVADIHGAKAEAAASAVSGLAITADIAEPDQVARVIDATVERYGKLDVLVNNAAITFVGDLDIPIRRHELVMAVNLTAPLLASQAAVPHLRAAGGGRILNVSSVAALYPHPGLMSYGISKIGLERLTVDLARQLQRDAIAVNCFRIDLPVASEGFVANTPGVDRSTWEPCEVAAEGVLWMLQQPVTYSGRRESMLALRHREGIMASRAAVPTDADPMTDLFDGLAPDTESAFVEPYDDPPSG